MKHMKLRMGQARQDALGGAISVHQDFLRNFVALLRLLDPDPYLKTERKVQDLHQAEDLLDAKRLLWKDTLLNSFNANPAT
ncbi:MAG: hypothetical protein O7B35_10695 [Deltaproteobacteria bacterium]|nr:hypothetical protein [Deltaproteobacteria bacterium]